MDSHDPKDFVLNRELSEVHLLIDNLSANPDKTFELMSVDDTHELSADWVEQICRITWPPEDAPQKAADQAALLIRAKDRLNTLAKPASGASIAFTLLVTQEENSAATAAGTGDAPSRRSMARDAYPGLIRKASAFRLFMTWMGWILLIVLILTCLMSWYVAFGNATLAEGADAQATLATAEKRVNDADAGTGEGSTGRGRGAAARAASAPLPAATTAPGATGAPAAPAVPVYVVSLCDRAKVIPALQAANGSTVPQFETVSQMQACSAQDKAEQAVRSVDQLLRKWLNILTPFHRMGRLANASEDFQETLVYAGSVLHILGSSVLPVFYGILGAAAAIVRSLSRKIKLSTLAPRDLMLSWQQLALGAVMGACIGLFVSQPGASGSPGLMGAIALSTSALSFVAGFGVDQVFMSLEALIGRIFAVVQPGPAPSGKAGS